ncbi:heavy-metal-associated domain-containing protein [Eleftheria terrae]|uniref:heavy-metal-associated domain-containing protein n=1 Tax=Eleftheria terrae TaxID=1597781 RepID=UPI00263B6484|nr:cation transporter [Eleftheria terrae]WKB51981.1 cation transporter [Eleftheria terrae]
MKQTFQVEGMSCGHCVQAVTRAVQALDARAHVQVDLSQGRVEVDSEQAREALARAIADEGYKVLA